MNACRRLAESAARRRERPSSIGIKINLYNAMETEAVDRAISASDAAADVECLMVGDSYLMTHLGRSSTRLREPAEQDWFLGVLAELVREVSAVVRRVPEPRRPLLVGDMPDGSTESPQRALAAADRLVAAGADVVKVELGSTRTLPVLDALVAHGHAVLAHVGYTPQQDGTIRRHGDTLEEALALFWWARTIRDCGACGLVLELVCEPVNAALCSGAPFPIYSIFSGKARCGGQSLNVWDAVFVPERGGRYFPPTAREPRSAYPTAYTSAVIEERMTRLLELTRRGEFPLSPPCRLSATELDVLRRIDPWTDVESRVAAGTAT